MYISGEAIGAHDLGTTSPTFIVGTPTTASDYTLDELSVGYLAASDGNNIGVINTQLIGDVPIASDPPTAVKEFENL